MRQFYTSVTDLRQPFSATFETFPYETAWASEAIYFVTADAATPETARIALRVQLSADGVRWLDEGTTLNLTGPSNAFARISHFGGYLRLAGETVDDSADESGPHCTMTVRLALKE